MTSELILYGTDHCTLCEEALDMLLSMPELGGRTVQVVDVAADDELLEALGDVVPMLEVRSDGAAPVRLDWPFDASRVLAVIG